MRKNAPTIFILIAVAVMLAALIIWRTAHSDRVVVILAPPNSGQSQNSPPDSGGTSQTRPGAPGAVPAPAASGVTLNGQKWNLQDQRGKVVLLDFWATWCGPCVASLPEIKKVHDKFSGNGDFLLVGISEDYTKPDLETFIKEKNVPWLQVFDRAGDGDMARKFGIEAIPTTFLIDRQGNMRKVELSADELIQEIERLLKPA